MIFDMFRLCLYASRPAGYECGEYKDAEPDCYTNGAPDKIEYFGGESGGIGRFNERGAVSQYDPIAERVNAK